MRKGNIGVAPEGLPFLFLLALTALAFAALRFWPLALVFLVLTWFSGHFFRDPERVVPSEDDIAVSPADGRVIRVEPKADPITGEVRPCISIFMNVFNVHVNRSPVAGRVEAIRYFPGKFFNAALDKASTDNERCAYLVRDDGGRSWVMVQVAGLIARRIVCRVEEGDTLARGERYGMIRFGSSIFLLTIVLSLPTVMWSRQEKASWPENFRPSASSTRPESARRIPTGTLLCKKKNPFGGECISSRTFLPLPACLRAFLPCSSRCRAISKAVPSLSCSAPSWTDWTGKSPV